jgi:copper(I)-binding protein
MRPIANALLILLSVLTAGAGTAAAGEAPVSIHDPWIREAPPGVPALAGYLAIENISAAPVVLLGASSPAFDAIMLHRTETEGGMAKMTHESQVEVAPQTTVSFAPGGYHLMLMGPKQPLKTGDQVEISLAFDGGLAVPVSFAVRRGEAEDTTDHAHHMHMQH